jgi:hypothetical protein
VKIVLADRHHRRDQTEKDQKRMMGEIAKLSRRFRPASWYRPGGLARASAGA